MKNLVFLKLISFKRCIIFIFLPILVGGAVCHAQNISGYVYDEQNNPVAFANIFVRELQSGTSADNTGHFFLNIDPGIYNLVVSSVGFEAATLQVIVRDKPLELDFYLKASNIQLDEIVVKAKKKDPAYEIIQNAIDHKEKHLAQVFSFRASVYLKATEIIDDKKKEKQAAQEEIEDLSGSGPPRDPIAERKKKEEAEFNGLNMVEMQLMLNFQYPIHYKEERTAYKAYGQKEGLFIPLFSETDFNFYHNLVNLKGISEVPVISPLSKASILSYKFKLEDVLKEEGQVVYKIRVIPRKTGDATCKGLIYINDNTWNINRLELDLPKGGLKFFDAFTIKQNYKQIEDSLWIPFRQEFAYHTKAGQKTFEGNTLIVYDDYEKDYAFPAKFFGNEVSVITKEAYKRDSAFWNSSRPEPLSLKQQQMVRYRDSIEAVHNSREYLDSIEASFNKVRLGEILVHGMGFRKEARKSSIYISPLLGMIGFEVIGGFRLGPYYSYFRRFENGRMFSSIGSFSMGFKNNDMQGNLYLWTRYNPFKLGDVSLRVGRGFLSVNPFDAYLNQLSISNYILDDYAHLFHRIELFNGFYLSTDLGFHHRQSLDKYDRSSIISDIIGEDDPLQFQDYRALISNIKISYTPMQRYMKEPNQKVVLGSKYPTFSISHRKGFNNFISDIDFDYVELSAGQDLMLGTLGNTKYALMAGKFVNSRDLRYVDLKRFRQSDPFLYSDPLHSFQLLDTALSSRDLFLEAHFIHHFNGAMINNLPLIKLTKLRTVAGGGFMWLKESNFHHQEVFGGVERVFKMGARRRLRIGVFGVLSQTSFDKPRTGYKVSFDIIDTWKRNWSY